MRTNLLIALAAFGSLAGLSYCGASDMLGGDDCDGGSHCHCKMVEEWVWQDVVCHRCRIVEEKKPIKKTVYDYKEVPFCLTKHPSAATAAPATSAASASSVRYKRVLVRERNRLRGNLRDQVRAGRIHRAEAREGLPPRLPGLESPLPCPGRGCRRSRSCGDRRSTRPRPNSDGEVAGSGRAAIATLRVRLTFPSAPPVVASLPFVSNFLACGALRHLRSPDVWEAAFPLRGTNGTHAPAAATTSAALMNWPAILRSSVWRLAAVLVLGCGALLVCASSLWAQASELTPPCRTRSGKVHGSREFRRRHDESEAQAVSTQATDAQRIAALERDLPTSRKRGRQAPSLIPATKRTDDGWVDHVRREVDRQARRPRADSTTSTGPTPVPAIVGDTNYFEFRRLRLVADGTGYGVYDFRLQMTLEPETVGERAAGAATSPDVKDAYFSMNEIPLLGRCRIGNFFVPFSLEQVTNDTNNIFLERSIPTQGIFAADREVGMAFYNCTEDQNFTWATGIFFDSISEALKERIDDNQGYRLSGRAHLAAVLRRAVQRPLPGSHRRRRAVHRRSGRPRPVSRPAADSRRTAADRQRQHCSPTPTRPATSSWRSSGARSRCRAKRSSRSVDLTAGEPATVNGAYVHVQLLPDRREPHLRAVRPARRAVRPQRAVHELSSPCRGCRGSGAWEAKARWSHLNLNERQRRPIQRLHGRLQLVLDATASA